jgi:hypothetical protein
VSDQTTALIPAALAPADAPPAADAPLHALRLFRDLGLRRAAVAVATTELFARPDAQLWASPQTIDELWQMQAAVRHRFLALQQTWAEGWFKWARYAADLGGANTVSKFAERQYNIAAQAVQLTGAQTEGLLGLIENVEIGYLYWISRKVEQRG